MKWLSFTGLGTLLTQGLAFASALTSNGNHTRPYFKASAGNNIPRASSQLTQLDFTQPDFTQPDFFTEDSRPRFINAIKKRPVKKNNISNISSHQSKRRVRRSNKNENNASTTSPKGQSDRDHQPKNLKNNPIPCHLQAPLKALMGCDQYVLVSQVNEKLRS